MEPGIRLNGKEHLMMNKYTSSERKVDLYDIGDGLTLMNIVTKNEAGKTKVVQDA